MELIHNNTWDLLECRRWRELQVYSKNLDPNVVSQMKKIIQELTTTGSPSLDVNTLKKFKRLCRDGDDNVRFAFYLIMSQLKKNHSEIRLSASQVADELFNRSHAFREILVNYLNEFLALTTETEASKPLPPPKAAAVKMKTDTLKMIQQWYDKYGQGYRKLVIGYDYLKNCKHIDFNDIRARSVAERMKIEEEERKKQKIMALRLAKVLKEISEEKDEIMMCVKEAESCLQLLLPSPDDFLRDFSGSEVLQSKSNKNDDNKVDEKIPPCKSPSAENHTDGTYCLSNNPVSIVESPLRSPELDSCPQEENDNAKLRLLQYSNSSADTKLFENSSLERNDMEIETESDEKNVSDSNDSDKDECVDDQQLHGLHGPEYTIEVDLGQPDIFNVQETSDNIDVVRTLKESSKTISVNLLPKVTAWLEILSKTGAKEEDIKATIDLKVQLECVKQKCVELKLVSNEKQKLKDADSDEEDFEDVPEKEGYEPHIPAHLRTEYGLDKRETSAKPEHESASQKATLPLKTEKSWQWNLKEKLKKEYTADPTSLAAAMARVNPEKLNVDSSAESKSCPGDSKDSSQVPFKSFGTDLAFWDNPDEMEAPSIVKYDSLHRFWTPKEFDSEKPSQHDLSALRTRVVTYAGKFEPVKWTCRAPMPNGKLCERMDRYKCPFHGKVIPRDEHGNPQHDDVMPSSSGTRATCGESSSTEDNSTLPPWKDPELQREIEHATGKDLGSARSQKELEKKLVGKGKGKGKGKKTSNLTDINASKNTSRKRIENKIFNKGSVKRVCATLDSADYRRVRDKFGNQFNYSLS
ncbi:UV-stimulated scaffold protein a [Plakobranchus ocellatus]|uniref:UV-stimulated scaffold protein a n=1 Tax=Plakobranchus ocellatus TaxID=259542 RepID=A0AAV3XWR1_9GAST|nr:UV-stimulated scaffold protein a [Plakobranchus ocellatus]